MRYAALVVLVALATRLVVVLWLHETVPYSDFVIYHAAGVETARDPGFLFDRAAATRLPQINLWPPGYPLFLAGVYALSGPNHRHAVFAQILLGVLVCGLVYRIVSREWGARLGCVAGLLVACHPHLVFLTNQLASENLYLVWLTLALLLALQANLSLPPKRLFGFGVVIGLGALTRAIGLVVPIVLTGWWRQSGAARRTWLRSALWLLLGVGVTILPWSVRNLHVTGHPALLCSGGGLNFYFGNNSESIGYRDLAATPLAGLHDPAAIDAAAAKLALQWLVSEPLAFVGHGVRKIVALYGFPDYALHVNSGILVPDTRGHPELEATAQATLARQRGRDRWLHGPLMRAARAYHVALMALAALGIYCGWRQKRNPSARSTPTSKTSPLLGLCTSLVVVWTAAHVLFWAQPRFRYPLEPALAVLATFALATLAARVAGRPSPREPAGLEAPRRNR